MVNYSALEGPLYQLTSRHVPCPTVLRGGVAGVEGGRGGGGGGGGGVGGLSVKHVQTDRTIQRPYCRTVICIAVGYPFTLNRPAWSIRPHCRN